MFVASDFLLPDPLLVAFPVPFPAQLPNAPSPPSTAVGAGRAKWLVVEFPLENAYAVADPDVEADTTLIALYD